VNHDILNRIRDLINQLDNRNKVLLALAAAVSIFALILLFAWANRPEYQLLYSSLDAGDAAKVVEDLAASNIPYQLKDGGSTILVPKNQIYELRLRYAGQNLISSGAVGYELFDQNNLGLTDFMQKVNLKRALEGELANTINQIEAVVQSRVHLVIPEPALFADDENKATASVIVKLRPSSMLERKQIMGISRLVAASVEGLSNENVVVVDTYGAVLTKNETADDEIGLSSSQYELQKNVEQYLAKKAQTMLDQVLGASNSIVRVAATLNFEKLKRTTESIDPDNVVVLSEERNEERSVATDTTSYQRENTLTNYELNKVIEQYESSIGDLKTLSVAVFVNGLDETDEAGNEVNSPRPEEEITIITEIVKRAVGYEEARGDQVVVQQLAFDQSNFKREREVLASIETKETLGNYVKVGLVVVGGILLIFILRSFFKKTGLDDYMKKQREQLLGIQPQHIESKQPEMTEEMLAERLANDNQARLEAQEKVHGEVKNFTSKDTQRAARILRYWLVDKTEEDLV
jgi:flagellar M-ring protein FliF